MCKYSLYFYFLIFVQYYIYIDIITADVLFLSFFLYYYSFHEKQYFMYFCLFSIMDFLSVGIIKHYYYYYITISSITILKFSANQPFPGNIFGGAMIQVQTTLYSFQKCIYLKALVQQQHEKIGHFGKTKTFNSLVVERSGDLCPYL